MSRLVLSLGLIALPGMSLTDRTATAAVAPVATSAVERGNDTSENSGSSFEAASWDESEIGAVQANVFAMGLRAAKAAIDRGDASDPGTLTIIDFSKPSTQKRMWVYDLRSRTLLFEEVVSHGRGSGVTMATIFSNLPESNRSSLGLFRMAETYVGKHGYSLRLDGLEPGVNDRARERAIVMHAADYVNPVAARAQGYLGRSLGCPALRPAISRELIDTVKNGGLLFAYYPDQQWLRTSRYIS